MSTRRFWFLLTCGGVATGAPAAAQVLSRVYLVFFDWDSAVVRELSRQIMLEAAREFPRIAAGARNQTPRPFVHVVGSSDGDDAVRAYALGFQRANAMAGILRNAGVPAANLVISSVGNQQPLIPGSGREPQNRSVILFLETALRARVWKPDREQT